MQINKKFSKSVKNIYSFKGLPFEAHIINHRHHIWEWHNLDKDKNNKMNTHIPCFCIYLHLIFYFICFFIVHLSTQLNIHLHMLCAYTCMCTLTLLFKPVKSIFHIPLSFTLEYFNVYFLRITILSYIATPPNCIYFAI